MPNERENYVGIVKRGLKEEWGGFLRSEYEFSMAICRSLASDTEVFVKEAFEQGTLLTQADLSILLNASIKTIGRHIKVLFVLRLIERRQDYVMKIDSGQVLWLGVKKEEKQNYGKNASNTEIVPVTLTLLAPSDIDMLSSGFTMREVRERRMVRLFKEGYEQGGDLSNNNIALLLNISPSTVSKQVREYMERTKEVVPTRRTVHDLGRAITHKRILLISPFLVVYNNAFYL